jgi:hypothetical protein
MSYALVPEVFGGPDLVPRRCLTFDGTLIVDKGSLTLMNRSFAGSATCRYAAGKPTFSANISLAFHSIRIMGNFNGCLFVDYLASNCHR